MSDHVDPYANYEREARACLSNPGTLKREKSLAAVVLDLIATTSDKGIIEVPTSMQREQREKLEAEGYVVVTNPAITHSKVLVRKPTRRLRREGGR